MLVVNGLLGCFVFVLFLSPLPPGGGRFFWILSLFILCSFLGVPETVAGSVGLNDVDSVGNTVEEGAGEPFASKDLRPVLEGKIGRKDDTLAFIGPAEDFKEKFGPGLGKWNIAELVKDEKMVAGKLSEQTFELPVVPGFQQLGDEGGDRVEADVFSLGAGGMPERGGDVGLTGAGIAHEQDVLVLVKIFAAHKLGDQGPVDGRLGGEVEGVEGLEDGEPGGTDTALGGALFPFEAFALAQTRQKLDGVVALFGTGGGHDLVVTLDGGQLQKLEVMVEQHGRAFGLHHLIPPGNAHPASRAA